MSKNTRARALLLAVCVSISAASAVAAETGEVTFRNDELTLGGVLHIPEGEGPFPAVVFIRGSGPSQRGNYWVQTFVDLLGEHGIAALVPDKRGSDRSKGDWRTADFATLAGDALAAVEYAGRRDDVDAGRIGLIGLSQGGKIAPIAAARSSSVAFVINVVGAATTLREQVSWEMYHTFREAGVEGAALQQALALQLHAEAFVAGAVSWNEYHEALKEALDAPAAGVAAGFPQTEDAWQWTFYRQIMDFDPLDHWARVTQPVLVLYGESDHNAPTIRSAYRLLRTWREMDHPDATLRIVPGAGHPLWAPDTDPHRPRLHPQVTETLSAWIARVTAVESH